MGISAFSPRSARGWLGIAASTAIPAILSFLGSPAHAQKEAPVRRERPEVRPLAGAVDMRGEATGFEGHVFNGERGGITLLYSENFDAGMGTFDNSILGHGLWHPRLGNECGTGGLFSNVMSYSRAGLCDYDAGTTSGGVMTPLINTAGYGTVVLQLLDFGDEEDGGSCFFGADPGFYDRMEVYLCDAGGNPLFLVHDFVGDRGWAPRAVDLSAFAGGSYRIMFWFNTIDGVCNEGRGWWIDNIEVLGIPGETDPCDEETTPPVILNCPSDFTTTCNGEGGFYFTYYPEVEEECSYTTEVSWTNPIPYGVNPLSVTVTDQAGNSTTCEFTVTVLPDPKDPYRGFSIGTQDGWVRQPDMVHMIEGPVNTKASTFDVGDGSDNWGRRGVLSFDTSTIPADATITAAYIRLTRSTVAGNPSGLGRLILDMGPMTLLARGGGGSFIGFTALLEPTDYDLASASNLDVAPSFPYPAANGHTVFANIDPAYFGAIDRTGLTQFRVRYETESDMDNANDFISFHSGDASSTVVRPELVVEYYTEGCQPCAPANPCDGPTIGTFWSTPVEDGGLMESHYTSEVGGTANSGATTSPVGDTASRQQLQVLLNFDTSSIPSDAQILSAELRVYRASATGGWAAFGPIWIGMRNPCTMPWWYGSSGLLAASDFEAINSIAPVGTLTVPSTNTYTSTFLSPAGLAAINRGGMTQMKLFYPTADDGDAVADQVQIGTGNYGATSPGRPRLVVTYDPCSGGGF